MKKLNIVLTGGNNGIGFQTAKALYNNGHNIVFGSRNVEKNEKAVEKISQSGKGYIISYPLDLSKKQSVAEFAQNVKKQFPTHIDQLINNSGMIIAQKVIGELGVQMTMTINHFGHFYLTYLLFDLIKQSKEARILNLSSIVHGWVKEKNNFYDNLQYNDRQYQNLNAYSTSKLANIHFTQALAAKFKEGYPNIKAVAIHPGIVDSGFGKNEQNTKSLKFKIFTFIRPIYRFLIKNTSQGATTTLHCSNIQFDKLKNGQYYADNNYKQMDKRGRSEIQIKKLWQLSEKLFGIRFKL